MEKFLYPNHPGRCIIMGPAEGGKSAFLTNLLLNKSKEYDKIFIYSPGVHQDLCQKLFRCFAN